MTHAASAPLIPQPRVPQAVPVVILGTDALLAAAPATPVQLAHACLSAGYANAIPVSWGDELIAAATLRELPHFGNGPAIQCSCPMVAHRLLSVGGDLRAALVALVSPPVAVARYLRALSASTPVRITYVGRCPGASDDAIDIRMTPDALLATLAEREIHLDDQPRVFESVIPPDRRRFRSQPGGMPTPDMLWSESGSRTLVDIEGPDLVAELAQHLLAGKNVLVDVAPRLGCFCSGAVAGTPAKEARGHVVALEPPRATTPVVDEGVPVEMDMPIPAVPRTPVDVVAVPAHGAAPVPPVARPGLMPNGHRISPVAGVAAVREPRAARSSSPVNARAVAAALPTTRDAEGKALPRAYVARRRSSPKGLPALAFPPEEERDPPALPPRRSSGIRVAPKRLTSGEGTMPVARDAKIILPPTTEPVVASPAPVASAMAPASTSAPPPIAAPTAFAEPARLQTMLTPRNLLIGAIVLLLAISIVTVSLSAMVAAIVQRSLHAAPVSTSLQR